MLYVELILPLALRYSYHYRIAPDLLFDSIEGLVGRRVLVSFGSKRFYTAIISSVSTSAPEGIPLEKLKFVDQILDEDALIPPYILDLWRWVASYYHCSLGQVMRSAIPSGLIPESQTCISLTDQSLPDNALSPIEAKIVELLEGERTRSLGLGQLNYRLGRNLTLAVSRLVELGIVQTEEQMHLRYKPLKNIYLQIADPYRSDDGVSQALELLRRAPKQQQMLLRLCELLLDVHSSLEGSIPRSALTQGESGKATLVRALVEREILQLVEEVESRIETESTIRSNLLPASSPSISLEHPVSYLRPASPQDREQTIVSLVHRVVAEGGQVLLLSPSAQLMPSSKAYLEELEKASGSVYHYHPLISEAKRTEIYKHLSENDSPCLVIGTRSAVFLPLSRLKLIIVEQEHEYLYKQQFAPPLYHARDIALWIGHQRDVRVLLTSQTPSAESLFNILRGKYSLISSSQEKVSHPSQINLQIIDLNKQRKEGRIGYDQLLSLPLRSAIDECLSRSERILLLQNRRGYAPYLLCQVCGERVLCPRCDVSLSYYHSDRQMRCHYCDHTSSPPTACPSCGARDVSYPSGVQKALRLSGYGIERVEEELRTLYPNARILRMDSDSLQTQKKIQEAWLQITSGDVDIILGTQLIKNQPLWDNIGLVGVLQLDTMLAYPDFRSYERAYQLLYQLYLHTERAGHTLFCLQTSDPDQPFIDYLRALDYDAFVKEQLSERNAFAFPPFVRLTYITFYGRDEDLVHQSAQILLEELDLCLEQGATSGVQRPSIARISGQYIRQIVCKRSYRRSYLPEREAFVRAEEALRLRLPHSSRVRIVFDIDPL